MTLTLVIVILLVGIVLFMQARKRGDTRQGRNLRVIALVVLLCALALAIVDAFEMVQDNDATEPAPRGIDPDDLGSA